MNFRNDEERGIPPDYTFLFYYESTDDKIYTKESLSKLHEIIKNIKNIKKDLIIESYEISYGDNLAIPISP